MKRAFPVAALVAMGLAGPFGLFGLVACGPGARVPGPQLTDQPPGLAYMSNPGPAGRPLAGMEAVRQRAWARVHPPSISVSIAEHRGALRERDVEAARRELLRVAEGSVEESRLEPILNLEIDGQPAWGWFSGEARHRGFTAFVSHGDATFVVGISSSDPAFLSDRQLRSAVTSFRRNPDRVADVLVPLAAGAILLGAGWAWWRRRASVDPGDRTRGTSREF